MFLHIYLVNWSFIWNYISSSDALLFTFNITDIGWCCLMLLSLKNFSLSSFERGEMGIFSLPSAVLSYFMPFNSSLVNCASFSSSLISSFPIVVPSSSLPFASLFHYLLAFVSEHSLISTSCAIFLKAVFV